MAQVAVEAPTGRLLVECRQEILSDLYASGGSAEGEKWTDWDIAGVEQHLTIA